MEQGFTSKKLPWEGRESLYEYVKKHMKKGMICPDYRELPDKMPVRVEWGSYDPGCDDYWDMYVNPEKEVNPKFINRLVDLFERYSRCHKLEDKVQLYKMLKDNPINGYWEAFVDKLSERMVKIEENTLELARWMVCEAPDREVVKFGIILLGLIRDPDDLSILKTIGRHEEFTFYVGQALYEITPMWDIVLIDIIRPLYSFGRVLAINMLLYNSEKEEVRRWYVRHGFKNFYARDLIMWECLEIGNMLQELRQEEWDEPLMEATQVIVCDLLNRHATAHKYGGEIIHLYLKRTIGKKRGFMQFYILNKLADYLNRTATDKSLIEKLGFTEEDYSNVWIDVNREIKKPWFIKMKKNEEPTEEYPDGIKYLCERAFFKLTEEY